MQNANWNRKKITYKKTRKMSDQIDTSMAYTINNKQTDYFPCNKIK